ncbi:SusD/RagB family nutrient-binding outer membrane lipoprotein [Bacteroides sp.]
MKYKYLIAASLLLGSTLLSSCRDEFADLNSDPSGISQPNIRYLFTQCESQFQPADYAQWFAAFKTMGAWAQVSVLNGGNTSKVQQANGDGMGWSVNSVLLYTNEIKYQISLLPAEEKAKYEYIQYLCNPLCVFLSMGDTDMLGSRQYSEAQMIRYGGTATPKYDSQEELYALWLKQLDETLTYLANNQSITDILGTQDFIYGGKLDKWARFTNSLKLKIAARLINRDRARALAIVNEAAANPAGFLTDADDFIMNKGKNNNNFNNNLPAMNFASKNFVEFLKANRDVRLFTIFTKNSFNSNVVQAYFDQNREEFIPKYIMDNVDYKVEGGKKVFIGWKGLGEPWVRYYGVPCQVDINKEDAYKEYFDPKDEAFWLKSSKDAKVAYSPISERNTFAIKGNFQYEFPDAPDVAPKKTEQYGWYGLYFSAGEVNLLLAEFKLLGANLPQSAQSYLTEGVKQSMKSYNKVAGLNHLPYYDAPYSADKFDVSINVKDADIDAAVDTYNAYKLDGTPVENLEKVYIQQMIHYMMLPTDMFVTSRRSGVPMKNSAILPREEFSPALGDAYVIPRRFPVSEPLESDIMRDLTIKAYEAQGFTYKGELATLPLTLSKERVWSDMGSPEYGAGPIVQ